MSQQLQAGSGQCKATARLWIKPVQAAIELGAVPDVFGAVLNAVHHVNRQGAQTDRIAVAFPDMKSDHTGMVPGFELELFGSDSSLSTLLSLDGIAKLKRRGMLVESDICEVYPDPGQPGVAFVRDRTVEKRSPGWIKRSKARAERRGKPVGAAIRPRAPSKEVLNLRFGDAVVRVREQSGEIGDAPLMVNTYGFSSPQSPAVLPVITKALRAAADAA